MKQMQMVGRSCGECTACCLPFAVPEVGKVDASWCPQCTIGKGCNIYPTRPYACREFTCVWLNGKGEESDRPDRLGVMMDIQDQRIGDKEIGIFHLWEIRPGALNQSRVVQVAKSVEEQGFVVASHKRLSNTQYEKILRIPKGLLSEAETLMFYSLQLK